MKQVCINSNVVFVFNRNVYDDFDTQDIEDKIKNVYSAQTPEIGSTNFPNEIKAVFSPSEQIQVVGQQRSIVISDSKINESNEITNTNFLRLSLNVLATMSEKSLALKQYGFNFTFSLEEEAFQSIQEKIKQKYFNQSIDDGSHDVMYALPNFCFTKDGLRYTLKYDVQSDEDGTPNKVVVAANVHNSSSEIPSDVGEFIEMYKAQYLTVYTSVGDSE